MGKRILSGLLFFLAVSNAEEFRFQFDDEQRRWTLSNGLLEAEFRLTAEGRFEATRLRNLLSPGEWTTVSGTSPIRFRIDETWFDARTTFRLLSQSARRLDRNGFRQSIHLAETSGAGQVILDIEMYSDSPVIRFGVRYRNSTPVTVHATQADFLYWNFQPRRGSHEALAVEQWMPVADPADFERLHHVLEPGAFPFTLRSGAHGRHCTWAALRDSAGNGLAAGWEFDGRATVSLRQTASGTIQLDGSVDELHHPVEPSQDFQIPWAFIGLFQGGWDEAGSVTQRFVEKALSKRLPQGVEFPFVSWDSWAYGQALNEATLRRNAQIAARLGMETFVVDLGWARRIGDWEADPSKFPSGLRALSDYVHSLGMKFGLHFAWSEADAQAPVLESNPDWTSSGNEGYYGARSLCLSHKPVRSWIIAEALRIIDEYNVDWILQDGENMVKRCTKSTHTHRPEDSNYSNAVDGLDYILKEIQRQRPHVMWENCENGGNLMTFQMVQNYVTSIVNDASGALGSRQAVWGATYPFPPRYADRYMPETRLSTYVTRSYLFGGPWIFMNRLDEMASEDLDLAAREIAWFKRLRGSIARGKVLHIGQSPAQGITDAIASYDEAADSAVAIVTRDGSASGVFTLAIGEFNPNRSYRISFAEDSSVYTMTGGQIAHEGVPVRLPSLRAAEIVLIEPLN